MKSATLLSLAALSGSTLAVPMMANMQQGHAVAHINAEALKNNLETAKANSMQHSKRQTQPNTAVLPLAAPSGGSVPSITLTDLDRVVSSVGVIVKGAQDDLKKIDIKDPQGITGILSQLLGNTTRAIQQGTTRIKANQKAMILPVGGLGGWGVASGLGGLGALGGLTNLNGLGGVTALGGVTNGLAGLTGITGLLTSLLNTVTGLLGNLLQLGGGSLGGEGSGLDLGSLTDLANLSNLLAGLTGGVTGTLPLGDLSNLAGIISPDLLNQLLSGAGGVGQPLGVVQSLVQAVLDLVNSLLPGVLGVTGQISGGVTVAAP
ncbi:hypothetical protein B0T20DRAFT_420357 [Sordaria brevicollis]|uniref:Uncharacterized protein n=1 Tax=Sordaria brevicollis TaxID=83679 RepID=A0AAE0P9S7_SORBR|nr:hypothetical protein B0T20DRAFT_420357 [Sordaria brevicollis]